MAPEFLPFIGFGILVFVVIVALAVGAVLFALAMYLRWKGSARWVRGLVVALGCASLAAAMLVSAGLVFLGGKIRQYFLNEPFVTACGDGNLTKAQELLSRGASPDAYGIDFVDTALIAASSAGRGEIVALLLRSGARIDLKDNAGKTAAERAKENGHGEIVKILDDAKKHPPKT